MPGQSKKEEVRSLKEEVRSLDDAAQTNFSLQTSAFILHFQVPAGIGDFVWIYMKLVNLGRPLHIRVARCRHPRTYQLLELLPGVTFDQGQFSCTWVLRQPDLSARTPEWLCERARDTFVPIQLNTWLEAGNRIEGYMPGLQTAFHFDVLCQQKPVTYARNVLRRWQRWVTFYCANRDVVSRWKGWEPEQWGVLGDMLVKQYDLDGIALVGADWDLGFAQRVMGQMRVPVLNLVGSLSLSATMAIVTGGLYTVAFPSGIPILAHVLRAPLLMFYPAHLEPMQNAWADPEMIASGEYIGCQFAPPAAILQRIQDSSPLRDRKRA